MGFIALDQNDAAPRGFVPLDESQPKRGFTPLEKEDDQPSILKMAALENPLTASIEVGANLASQAVALPTAGLFGLYEAGGKALGFHDRAPAGVVEHMAEAMTYEPRGTFGKSAVDLATKPFQWLAAGGQAAGGKVLDATDSPLAATVVDTAINAIPMVISPALKKVKSGLANRRERIAKEAEGLPEDAAPNAQASNAENLVSDTILPNENAAGVVSEIPSGVKNAESFPRTERMASDASTLRESEPQGFQALRSEMDQGLPGMEGELPTIPERYGAGADGEALARQAGRDGGLLPRELLLDDTAGAGGAPRLLSEGGDRFQVNDGRRSREIARSADTEFSPSQSGEWPAAGRAGAEVVPEIDLADAQRGDVAASRNGEASRSATGAAVGAPEGRMDARASVESRALERPQPILDPNAGPLSRSAAVSRPDLVIKVETAKPGAASADLIPATTEPKQGFTPLAESQTQPMAGEVQKSWAPGANYAPLIDDSRASATSDVGRANGRAEPIRREDVIIPFAKALGASIYTGRVKMKNALGFFRRGTEEVRIKRHADLEVTAHEMAHLIDSRVPALSREWRSNAELRQELKSVSYDQNSVPEGWAESVRLWMTQPEVLQQRAPMVANWIEGFVASDKKYGPAMRKAQEGMVGWFAQDAVDRARSKIGDHRSLSDAMNGIFDRFRQSTVDDLHGIYRMERELQGGKLKPVGAYESARLSRASASIADGAVRFGYPVKNADGSFTYRGKGLQDILKPVAESLDDALLYFVGRSAQELMMQGREHLFTKGEIRGMLALETPEARKAFAEYQAWNRGVLDFAEAQGVLNPETRAKWKRTEYLPFHRIEQPGGLKGKPGDWSGVQALTGGTENIRDVLGNMIGNAAQLIDVAVKNEARVKIANLSNQFGGGKFMVKIDPGSRPVKVAGNQVLDEMAKRYGLMVNGETPAFFQFLQHNQAPAGSNVVAVLKQGKAVWYEVADPILLRSLESIDRPPMPWLTRWLGMPKRVGQTTITLTPDFMLANIARDTIMGAVMSRSGFRPVLDSINGMRLRLTNDPLYKDYIANGGGLSSLYLDEHHLRTKLEKFYSKQGIDYRTVLDAPDKLLNAIETMADAFEISTRLGEYKRAIDAGAHPRHAAYQGREVSTDFAMRGDSKALGFMYDTVMFLRPAVISMDRLYRGVAHDPNKAAIGAKTAMLALASVGLYLLNREDPRYQDLPDWDRDANWHFFIGDQHFRYPKIWEIGAVASTAERTVERLMESDPAGLGKDFARIIGNTFSLNYMPQILAPLYEQSTNRNSFTKAPLETPGMENVQPFLRAKPNTSETMKALGMASRDLPESLQVNPVRAEALLRGYLNTWAVYGLMLSDRAFFGDKLPEMRADEMPVVRRFYANEPAKHTKFETQFYDMLGEAKRLQGTLRELDRQGRPDIADQKEQSPLAGESKPLERANKGLQSINSEMKDVRRSDDLTPAEKRERLDALTVERNQLLKNAVLAAKSAQQQK